MQGPYMSAAGTTATSTTAAATTPATATTTATATQAGNPAMTLLAQLRALAVEQCGMVRTMHVVAQGTILRDREVFPQKGPALLCMTGVAVLVHCQLLQGGRSGTAMRIVAVAANHLALTDGMPGSPEGLGTDILVTLEADLSLGGAFAHLVGFVNGMATGTGEVLAFVDAGLPVLEQATLVTTPTHRVLFVWRGRMLSRVGNQAALVSTFFKHIDDMGFTRTVAGFTTLRGKRCAQIHLLAVLVVIDLQYVRGMALATGLAVEIAGSTGGCCLRLFLCHRFSVQTAAPQGHEQNYQGADEGMHIPGVSLAVPQSLPDSGC